MEHSSESPLRTLVSKNIIRCLQSKVQSEIENFETFASETTHIQTFNLCDIVRDRILNYEDEPQLSKHQNNFRRIHIASELIARICSVYDHIVDFTFTKIINDLLYLDKYKVLSSKITHKAYSNLKIEKYFAREAHTKLLRDLKDNERYNLEKEAEAKNELEITLSKVQHTMNTQKEISLNDIGQTLLEDSLQDNDQLNLVGDLTEIRLEPPSEVSKMNVHTGNIQNNISLQLAEISIKEPSAEQLMEEDIYQILQSGNKTTQTNIRKSGLSKNLLETSANISDFQNVQIEESLPEVGRTENRIVLEQDVEDWSLPTLEPVEYARNKYLRLRTDKLTVIPNYSIRAMHLNKNIDIQRVQVFEGPPKILQSMSPEYLMKTSGFKSFMAQNVRSSMLSKLFERNLTTEKKPAEPFILPNIQKRTMGQIVTERKSQAQERQQVTEDVTEGERVGMRSAPQKSSVLAEFFSEKTSPKALGNEALQKDTLISVAVPRRTSPVIELQEQEKINNIVHIPSPNIQQLQGTTLDPKRSSPPWFFITEEKPPRAKFREFNYIRMKLHNYWTLFEMQGMEKSISIREFLVFEDDGNLTNYLTVLRIVDKLSIQRQLFLEYKNGAILIKPFENPCF